MMDRIHEELDDAKAEIDRLRLENKEKTELSESLRRANNQQLDKIREISSELEKQREASNEKAYEASVAGQMLEELKRTLSEKEGTITHLSSANNKLRTDLAEKIHKFEKENNELVFKLEEEHSKISDYEQKVQGLEETIKSLKGLLSVSEKKRAEVEEKGKVSTEMRQRDDVLFKVEEENGKLEDLLKRKREQFEHLKQAHEKVKEEFHAKSKEWENEKSTLLDKIDVLQDNLDSQTRISKDLQSRLEMCNQALAHEESRRKRIEAQLLESKTCFDGISIECEEAKLKLVSLLSGQSDKEIAQLRNLLGTKETLYKEMEYNVRRLEQENQELVSSLKDFQEAQIKEAGSSSEMSNLRNKLKGLEQIHKECYTKFKAKEAEWRSEMEQLREELNCCRSEQESCGKLVGELRMELEADNSLITQLMLQSEESSVMLLVTKSELMKAFTKLADEKVHKDLSNMESEKNLFLLKKQLEMNTALIKTREDEWRSKMDPLTEELNCCRSEQEGCSKLVDELRMELEADNSLIIQLMRQSEESSIMLLVVKSEFMKAYTKLADEKAQKDLNNMKSEKNLFLLKKQLEMNTVLIKAKEDEWKSEIGTLTEELNCCRSEQENCGQHVKELRKELEGCHALITQLMLQTEMSSALIKAKEDEWRSEMGTLTEELNCCRSEQENCGQHVKELRKELEGCHALIMQLMLQTEEYSVMLLVVRSGFVEAYLRLSEEKAADKELKDMESENGLSLLEKQLEAKSAALTKALKDVEVERDEVESLSKRGVESLNQQLALKKELDMCNEMLMESSSSQQHLREQVLQVTSDLNKAHDALDRANEELDQKFCAYNEVEFELQIWKSIAEHLKARAEENYHLRKEVEASLLEQVTVEVILTEEKEIMVHMLEEKDGKIDDLEQKIVSLDQELKLREQSIEQVLEEKDRKVHVLQQKLDLLDQKLKMRETESATAAAKHSGLEKEIEWWEKEWVSKELERAIFAQLENERIYEHEKNTLHQLVNEKDQRIVDLQQQVRSLELEFENSTSSFASQLHNMEAETEFLHKAWDTFTTTIVLKELEIQDKNLLIIELENVSRHLLHKLELEEKTLSCTQSDLEAKNIELKSLTYQHKTEFRSLEDSINNLGNDKRTLSLENERLVGIIGELSDMIFKFYGEDMQLMGTLGRIVHNLDNDNGITKDFQEDEAFDPVKENLTIPSFPITMKAETLPLIPPPSSPSTNHRSPLRALNS